MFIVANWKMHGDAAFASRWADDFADAFGDGDGGAQVAVCPPFPLLPALAAKFKARRGGVCLGAQDCSRYGSGAHTGEVAASLLREAGCEFVIVGHSERRREMGEGAEIVGEKIQRALAAGLRPIVCVGESAAERERAWEIIAMQARAALEAGGESAARLIFAYEPVWAIGAGAAADSAHLGEAHRVIRAVLREGGGDGKIIYGGSVSAANAAAIFAVADVGGALVGGASLDAAGFAAIAKAAQ